jgi:hypothetical protein
LATVELEIANVKADERRKPATGVGVYGLWFRLSSLFGLVRHDTERNPVLDPARVVADPHCSECRLTDYEFSGDTR